MEYTEAARELDSRDILLPYASAVFRATDPIPVFESVLTGESSHEIQ